jgi:hypothetical protein
MYTTFLFWAFQFLCERLFQNMIFGGTFGPWNKTFLSIKLPKKRLIMLQMMIVPC